MLQAFDNIRETAVAKLAVAYTGMNEECTPTVCKEEDVQSNGHKRKQIYHDTCCGHALHDQLPRARYVLQVRQACVRGQPVPEDGGLGIRNVTKTHAVEVSDRHREER